MSDRATLLTALAPILQVLKTIDPGAPGARDALERALPLDHPDVRRVEALARAGVAEGWFAPRGSPSLRFGRVSRPSPQSLDFSIDAVVMDRPGPGHIHPRGEMDLCFALEGSPRFDDSPAGWVVYPPGSWHVPTVSGGRMAILYFLPGGAFQFAESPPQP